MASQKADKAQKLKRSEVGRRLTAIRAREGISPPSSLDDGSSPDLIMVHSLARHVRDGVPLSFVPFSTYPMFSVLAAVMRWRGK